MKKQVISMMGKKTDIRFAARNEESKEYDLFIYGPIGGFFFGTNAESVRRKLAETEAKKINVHINSPGGSAFDGVAISNLLKKHKAEVIIHVDGWAASAASVIAMAGDKIIMPENTMMMIHRASTIDFGNAAVFEKTASDLRKIDQSLAASYKKRFVGTQEELDQLLDDETFLTAEEAVAFGLADIVGEEIEIQDLEDPEDDQEDEEEYENFKDRLVAKYAAQATPKPNNQEPPEEEPTQNNVSKLFLNL
ncbi:peptidase S14 [Halalkalibacillus sediminis]|uniref:ATP-dependent Clp protease proteolytic subunit n=2 Tax=Halalkalibacillus sediminis TaxID=2018042 RepID=A0A2I0QYK2_9BACI|nr:peptidase S14 [Halalkalibacillus sediminis]